MLGAAVVCRSLSTSVCRSSTGAASSIVSPEWVNERLADVRVLDCSWYLPSMNRSGLDEYQAKRIPGANFFDVNGVSDKSNPLPHMLPSEEDFAAEATRLGVTNDTTVVVYDGVGMFTSPRAWWMFQHFGKAANVKVLGGGFPGWERAGLPVDTASPAADPVAAAQPFRCAGVDGKRVWSLATLTANCEKETAAAAEKKVPVLDARSGARFDGTAAEPRPGLPSGHMPGAASMPFTSLLTEGMATMLPPAELRAALDAHIGSTDEITVSCGSGVTACCIALAVSEAYGDSAPRVNLFDGSWTEYGSETVLPKLAALLQALDEIGDPDMNMSASTLFSKAPLLSPGLESLLEAVDTRLLQTAGWPGQQTARMANIKVLALDLLDNHVTRSQ